MVVKTLAFVSVALLALPGDKCVKVIPRMLMIGIWYDTNQVSQFKLMQYLLIVLLVKVGRA